MNSSPPVPAISLLTDGEASGSGGHPTGSSGLDGILLKPLGRRRFGRYDLLLEMGRGGMASLLLGRLAGPEAFEKLVAIKRIHDHLGQEVEFLNMFLDEARIAARIQHPNVAALFDLGEEDGAYYIAMEYVHGVTLSDILRRSVNRPEPFPWPLAVRIVADVAAGLHAAHSLVDQDGRHLGVVHRDVSPHNLLVSYDGHVKVIDFGIAYAARKLSQTKVGILKGKTGYMSPEQVEGEPLDARSDVFSLGIVLYECLTRARLFYADTDVATLLRVRRAAVPPIASKAPGLPRELCDLVHRALSRRPGDRFASAEEMSEALDAVLAAEGEAVTRKRLAAMMDSYFHERRQVVEQQIRFCQRGSVETPAVGAPAVLGARQGAQVTRPHTRLERMGGRLWLGATVALVALGLGAAALLVTRPGSSPPADGSSPDGSLPDDSSPDDSSPDDSSPDDSSLTSGVSPASRTISRASPFGPAIGQGDGSSSDGEQAPQGETEEGGALPSARGGRSRPSLPPGPGSPRGEGRHARGTPVERSHEPERLRQWFQRRTAREPLSSHVTVTVQVEPPRRDATVRWHRQTHHGSLSRLLMPRGDAPVPLDVKVPGYLPETLHVMPDQDRLVIVRLRPRPAPLRRPRPRSKLIDLD